MYIFAENPSESAVFSSRGRSVTRIALISIGLVCVLAVPSFSLAHTQDFTNEAEFSAATINPQRIDFNGILPAGVSFQGFNPLVVSGVTFSTPLSGVFVNVNTATYYTAFGIPPYPGDYIVNSVHAGTNRLVITLLTPTHAISLRYGGLGFYGSGSASITLSNGHVFSLPTLSSAGSLQFAGFISSDLISSLTLTITNDDWVVETVSVAEPREVPVILVHGWCGQPAAFGQMASLLSADFVAAGQRRAVQSYDYSSETQVPSFGGFGVSIEEIAFEFAGYVLRVLRDNSASQVDIVAHSMGGLVARAWMAGLTQAPYRGQIRHLVTVGTPNYGADISSLKTAAVMIGGLIKGYECSTTQMSELAFGSSFVSLLHDRWTLFKQSSFAIPNASVLVVAGTQDTGKHECDDNSGCDDGIVDISSAALSDSPIGMVRYVPYRHAAFPTIKPSDGATLVGIQNRDHLTYKLVRSFLTDGTVLPQCCGAGTIDYDPLFSRAPTTVGGLLLVRVRHLDGSVASLPVATSDSFEPRVRSSSTNNLDAGGITSWGVNSGIYDVTVRSTLFGVTKLSGISIILGRPTIPPPIYIP